ncbi:unnamed protein product [Rhizophagus irregularis]|nr:unnamed protein product [Rhizophagus irregularis]
MFSKLSFWAKMNPDPNTSIIANDEREAASNFPNQQNNFEQNDNINGTSDETSMPGFCSALKIAKDGDIESFQDLFKQANVTFRNCSFNFNSIKK